MLYSTVGTLGLDLLKYIEKLDAKLHFINLAELQKVEDVVVARWLKVFKTDGTQYIPNDLKWLKHTHKTKNYKIGPWQVKCTNWIHMTQH